MTLPAELRLKGKIEIEEVIVEYAGEWMLLRPGDTYVGQSEGEPPEILTCRKVEVQRRTSGLTSGKVFPKERKKKLYDLHEVVKIIVRKNPNPPKKESPNEQKPGPGSSDAGRAADDAGAVNPSRRSPGSPGRRGQDDRDGQRTQYNRVQPDRAAAPESSRRGGSPGRRGDDRPR